MVRLWVGFGMVMCLWAQGTDGVLTGTVTDPAGAVIPGASVTAKNAGTGVGKRVETGESGTYVLPGIEGLRFEVRGSAGVEYSDAVGIDEGGGGGASGGGYERAAGVGFAVSESGRVELGLYAGWAVKG